MLRAVEVVAPLRQLGPVASRSEHPISFTVRNVGSRPLRILGASSGCGKAGCIDLEFHKPFTIPTGQSREIEVTYRAAGPGPFACSFDLYTNAPGQATIKLTVIGETLDAGSPEDEAANDAPTADDATDSQ